MARRKKSITSNNDTRVAGIVLGLFIAAVVVFFIFPKNKESHKELHQVPAHKPFHKVVEHTQYVQKTTDVADEYVPNKDIKPIASVPVRPPVITEPLEKFSGSGGKIAIIIDDWGQSTANCRYLKEIPEPLAVSILPGLRHTKDVANCAHLYHKLAMLHLPLEALHNNDFYPSNYIIKTTMPPTLASSIVDEDLDQLPSIEGVNNHMGSKATEDKALMKLIFKKLKKKRLFFVDSMTAHGTVCAALADEIGLSFGKRDVFLDNENTREAIIKQIMALAEKASHRGYAVAIGHDRHLTMQVLKEEIPLLEKRGFQIVSIKTLLKNK